MIGLIIVSVVVIIGLCNAAYIAYTGWKFDREITATMKKFNDKHGAYMDAIRARHLLGRKS